MRIISNASFILLVGFKLHFHMEEVGAIPTLRFFLKGNLRLMMLFLVTYGIVQR